MLPLALPPSGSVMAWLNLSVASGVPSHTDPSLKVSQSVLPGYEPMNVSSIKMGESC